MEKPKRVRILTVYIKFNYKIMENLKYLTVVAYANGLLFKLFHFVGGNEILLLATLLLNVYLGTKVVKNILNK